MLRCSECMLWYHANIKVVRRSQSVVGCRWVLDAQFNHAYTRKDLNSILRCDCLARQVYMAHGLRCDNCNIVKAGHSAVHRIGVTDHDTLHSFITRLTKRTYDKSRLPAYTLQHRCGAIREYLMAYTSSVPISEKQIAFISKYALKRQQIRDGTDEKKSPASANQRQEGSDDEATGGGATPEPKTVVRRRSRA